MWHSIGRTALRQLQSLLQGFLQDDSALFSSVLTVQIGQRCQYRVMMRWALQSARLVTKTTYVPVNSTVFSCDSQETAIMAQNALLQLK
jgi:hypothetical protein